MAVFLGERRKAMDEPSQDERVETASRYAVAMHLEANRKVGTLALVVTIVAILVAIYARSFWPMAIAVVICIAIYFFVIQSCLRFVERQTGMPQELQAYFSNRYKTDALFAKEVDELHKRGSILARHF